MELTIETALNLKTGGQISQLGYGVYLVPDAEDGREMILKALEVGYRHIDTAAFYGNERAVGMAVRESGIPREEIFVTTKLWVDDHGFDNTLQAFEKSISLLGLDYVDLYLSHWPVQDKRKDTWRAMERLHKEERCKAIGVSNYMVRHMEEILGVCTIIPAVNQIELHPFNYRSRMEVIDYCLDHGIVVEAYSPLTKGKYLNEQVLKEVGDIHGKSPAQVLIRWALQKGLVVLPKSANLSRIEENADVFDFSLSHSEMALLTDLDQNLSVTWDPTDAP